MASSGYQTQSCDTKPEIERMLIAAYRKMTPVEKMARVVQLSQACTDLALAGIRDRYPRADEHEVRLRLGALRMDRTLMIKAFGWDPEEEGY